MILKNIIKKNIFKYNDDPFIIFQNKIHKKTLLEHDAILNSAYECLKSKDVIEAESAFIDNEDPLVREGYLLRNSVIIDFQNKYLGKISMCIMMHIPEKTFSPGGHSLFSNLAMSLEFIGVTVLRLNWHAENLADLLELKPNVFITSDHHAYLEKIDWNIIQKYRRTNLFNIGLTASIEEYGNTSLQVRLKWAKEHGVNFFYSFRAPEYINNRREYKPFFDHGFKIICVEFGANPLLYYPVPYIKKDLNYVFLASSNPDKWTRYIKYLPDIIYKYPGFINGPGWNFINESAPGIIHRFLYARAKAGINIHLQESIDWANELNERTYILAACGVPQLVDNPMLLEKRFNRKSLFVAQNEKEYKDLFISILNDPVAAKARALSSLYEVYEKHTTFHRAEKFYNELCEFL